jgi:hypothetical protein
MLEQGVPRRDHRRSRVCICVVCMCVCSSRCFFLKLGWLYSPSKGHVRLLVQLCLTPQLPPTWYRLCPKRIRGAELLGHNIDEVVSFL